MSDGSGERYSSVREQLESRGYLDGRIERFVLRDLVVEKGRARPQLVRTAAKAGLVGGPLLGILLALTAAGGSLPLLRWSDGLWLWLYCSVVAAGVLFGLVLLASGLEAVLVQLRGRALALDAVRAGLVVSLPTLVYLTVVGWRRNESGDWRVDIAFLVTANLAALVVAWLAGMISLANAIGRTGVVPDRRRRPIALVLLVLLPLSVAGWLGRLASGGSAPSEPSALNVPADGPRLVLIGVDGLAAEEIERLAVGDAAFGRWLGAASRLRLERRWEAEPAAVWTTMATGVAPNRHGVTAAGRARLPGVGTALRPTRVRLPMGEALERLLPTRTVPVSGRERHMRSLWEILALDRRTLSIGWWASWPADQDFAVTGRSMVLSDRVLPKLLAGGEPNRETSPAELMDRLRKDFGDTQARLRSRFDEAVGSGQVGAVESLAWESFLIDAFRWERLEELAADPGLRGLFVYLPGLDILERRLGDPLPPESAAVLERYRRWLAQRLSQASELAGAGGRVLLVADRGRESEFAPGLVAWWGAGDACVQGSLGPIDVAPLALALAGFPSSREMSGALPACAQPRLGGIPDVASFGRRRLEPGRAAGQDDAEMIERLKSLGYLR